MTVTSPRSEPGRPGAFGNDALNLPGTSTGKDAGARRQSPQQIFRTTREAEDLNRTPGTTMPWRRS
jgi:hypothetical protein